MLIVLEMANNHMGDVELGKRIIREHHEVTKKFPQFQYAVKFQYRDLDTFIHPSADPEHKYVKRFRETNLSDADRLALKEYAASRGFLTACTPFDEKSVEDVVRHGYDILKVGSPSFTDWPLWERILALWEGPIIASCGGATEEEIDKVVHISRYIGVDTFYPHKRDLTLMHCVSEYPTKLENAQLAQYHWLADRYKIPVGLSSHTERGFMAAQIPMVAYERHVCVIPEPNNYSVTPLYLEAELEILDRTIKAYGTSARRVSGPKPTQFMRQEIDGRMWWKP